MDQREGSGGISTLIEGTLIVKCLLCKALSLSFINVHGHVNQNCTSTWCTFLLSSLPSLNLLHMHMHRVQHQSHDMQVT